MKSLVRVLATVLTLSLAAAPAFAHDFGNGSTIPGDQAATQMQKTGAL